MKGTSMKGTSILVKGPSYRRACYERLISIVAIAGIAVKEQNGHIRSVD
jgi:hypothetical protein